MDKSDDNLLREARATLNLDGASQTSDQRLPAKTYRAKVFKSGNSLAVRIPVGTKLEAGMEMKLTVEDGTILSLEPLDRPKRKFNIDKVWGCARGSGLRFVENRDFEPRPSERDSAK